MSQLALVEYVDEELRNKSVMSIISFILSAVIILVVAFVWSDVINNTLQFYFDSKNKIWIEWVVGIILTVIGIAVLFWLHTLY